MLLVWQEEALVIMAWIIPIISSTQIQQTATSVLLKILALKFSHILVGRFSTMTTGSLLPEQFVRMVRLNSEQIINMDIFLHSPVHGSSIRKVSSRPA